MKKSLIAIIMLSFCFSQFIVAPKTGMIKNSGLGIWIQAQQNIEDTDADRIELFSIDYIFKNGFEVALNQNKLNIQVPSTDVIPEQNFKENFQTVQLLYHIKGKNNYFLDFFYTSMKSRDELVFTYNELYNVTTEYELRGFGLGWHLEGMFLEIYEVNPEMCITASSLTLGADVHQINECPKHDYYQIATLGKIFKLNNNLFFGTSYRALTDNMGEGHIGLSLGVSL